MPANLAFVHTAATHVPTFDALVAELGPGLDVHHAVHEDLLRDARTLGAEHPAILARTHAAMRAAADSGAALVVCTCSTIGAAAEFMDTGGRFQAARIDRAMADAAVRRGPAVHVLAALDSTLVPTQDLLQGSARRLGRPLTWTTEVVPEAWALFMAGDLAGYHAAIAQAARAGGAGASVIVLAQASMAGAADLLGDLGMPVLSSPRLGVQAAVAAVAALGARSG